ncbi:hypothetical protein D3C71_1514290 [compost metagenome]
MGTRRRERQNPSSVINIPARIEHKEQQGNIGNRCQNNNAVRARVLARIQEQQHIGDIDILRKADAEEQGQQPAVLRLHEGEQAENKCREHVALMHFGSNNEHDDNKDKTDKVRLGQIFPVLPERVHPSQHDSGQNRDIAPNAERNAQPGLVDRRP